MTKEKFINTLDVTGGSFVFETDIYEGFIGVSPNGIVIWVDDVGFGGLEGRDEPRNIGEYADTSELLSGFVVDGIGFREKVLPAIDNLRQMYYL